MVNMYGAGKAFNNRFIQNNYPTMAKPTNRRQAPTLNFFGCGHQHSGPQQVTINNGPQGVWGFLGGLAQGILGGGLLGGLFGGGNQYGGFNQMQYGMSPYGMINQGINPVTPQNQNQTQAQQLSNLKTLFPDYNIVSEDGGKFSTIGKKGDVISGNYEEMKTKLAADKGTKPANETVDPNKADPTKDDPTKDDPTKDDPTKDNPTQPNQPTNQPTNPTNPTNPAVRPAGARRTGGSPQGWYRAANDNQELIQASKGKNAKAVTNNLLTTKLNGALTPAQQNELTQVIIKKNPSVFDKSGNPLPNADYSKLDVPTMEWIKTNILKETEGNRSDVSGPNSATGRAMKQTTKVGNNQNYVNQFYTKGYRETNCKGIFYNESTKKHYKLNGNKLYEIKANVKQVNSDGTWIDTAGKKHAASELK